ncbi:alpha/beta hydrolase [Catellatospora sp. TT07R-123]|uniref:alpha/beta hydrolase n=1 Tax=Catellatospora sp. TT07R-123 TaxID=2733863 RepID=UPI001B1157DC|nr:alpha/beta hydrolase [Catellatospora sp. TT07R-123]GHJ45521.1 alpha/beta hydrolase [Catellatospora sp. TT07R-123]
MQTDIASDQIDILGEPYRQRIIELPDDDQGRVVATLVSRRAPQPTTRAVLYVHGFNDYFFQTHLADFFIERGYDFYALDLRKYGRSLLEHQTPNFTRSMDEYFPELDAAARIIRETDGHETMVVAAHSTGGLITALWAQARGDDSGIAALLFNSPFFDFNAPWLMRRPAVSAVGSLARRAPYRVIPLKVPRLYGRSIHRDHDGEWDFRVDWKPVAGFPVRVAWIKAIRAGQQRLHAGLDLRMPIFVACATRSYRLHSWTDAAHESDAVLDVDHIVRWAPALGRHLTLVRIDGGKHDLTLSRRPARDAFFAESDRWLKTYVHG